ncbi:MAG: aminotransferase class I/II-fold pyridoxal phosphate-dependent enzyme [Candidatus Microthrix sp.]|nr:aminotransferase class I/II-fold pyridoxal phosphate-dependent enzyme [Candidatus Microthrix sp.]
MGSPEFRAAASDWMRRRLDLEISPDAVAACVGTKEFVGSLALLLGPLVASHRDTVLVPAVAYPTYAVGADLAGCRVVRVPMTSRFSLDLDAVEPEDAARARLLWVNSPGNPAGGLDDLEAAAAWGRERGIVVCSDECYVEYTWSGAPVGEVSFPHRPCCPREARVCWRFTRCRSDPTWPGGGSGSTPATPPWSLPWVSGGGSWAWWCRGRCRLPERRPGATSNT